MIKRRGRDSINQGPVSNLPPSRTSGSARPASGVQHFLQSACKASSLTCCASASQLEHSKLDVKPKSKHDSVAGALPSAAAARSSTAIASLLLPRVRERARPMLRSLLGHNQYVGALLFCARRLLCRLGGAR